VPLPAKYVSLPSTPIGRRKLVPLPAKYVSLPSRRASPESAPAVDDSTRVAKSLVPLPAKYVSLPSRRASPESAPAVDDSTRVAKFYVPCVPWWHMLGDRTEKCSMCKIIGMWSPCLCVPVAMPLLSALKAWRVLGCRFQAAHSEEVPDWAAPASPAPRSEPHDYVRPVIGCSSVLACLSSLACPGSQPCEECEAI